MVHYNGILLWGSQWCHHSLGLWSLWVARGSYTWGSVADVWRIQLRCNLNFLLCGCSILYHSTGNDVFCGDVLTCTSEVQSESGNLLLFRYVWSSYCWSFTPPSQDLVLVQTWRGNACWICRPVLYEPSLLLHCWILLHSSLVNCHLTQLHRWHSIELTSHQPR